MSNNNPNAGRAGSNLPDELKPAVAEVKPARVLMVLEDSDNIPPTGQYFGVNGDSFMLRAGEEALVPRGIIDILNNAIELHPVKDGSDRVVRYRNRMRFPYRLISDGQRQAGA